MRPPRPMRVSLASITSPATVRSEPGASSPMGCAPVKSRWRRGKWKSKSSTVSRLSFASRFSVLASMAPISASGVARPCPGRRNGALLRAFERGAGGVGTPLGLWRGLRGARGRCFRGWRLAFGVKQRGDAKGVADPSLTLGGGLRGVERRGHAQALEIRAHRIGNRPERLGAPAFEELVEPADDRPVVVAPARLEFEDLTQLTGQLWRVAGRDVGRLVPLTFRRRRLVAVGEDGYAQRAGSEVAPERG